MKLALLLAIAAASLLLGQIVPEASAQTVISPDGQDVAFATLLEQDPNDRFGNSIAGAAKWRLEKDVSGSGSASQVQVSVDVAIPERQLAVALRIRPNPVRAVSVSHFIDIKFNLPRDFQHGGISTVPGIIMKQAERARGTALQGQMVKLLPNVFSLGLSTADVQRNVQLLYGQPWFDIAIIFANGRRALLVLEKGATGNAALKEAFASWAQLDPKVGEAISRIDAQQRSQETRPQANENERQRQRQASESLRSKFGSTYGVKAWTDDRALSRNPFVFKDDVVAVFTVFSKMLSANEALFVHNEPIVASGTPATLFRDSEHVVLAIRVLGNRPLRLPLGETTAALGEYVGVYKCEQRGCEEVYGR
jgi:hypothetical protein